MMNSLNVTTIMFLAAVWVISLVVATFEIIKIYKKSREIGEERLRKTFDNNIISETESTDRTILLEPDERDAELFHRLVFSQIDGKPSGHIQILHKRENYLGRDKNFCNICVNDNGVSSRHAIIVCDGENISVRNYATPTNQMYINGRPLFDDESVVLEEGAEVRIAQTIFKVYHRKKMDMKQEALSEN